MVEETTLLASAVVLPETDSLESATPTGATKRRQSSVSEADSKRQRRDSEALSPSDVAITKSPRAQPQHASSIQLGKDLDGRRRSTAMGGAEEDRKRGKRLFGSLLGTLSQSATSRTQKRREDIEKKAQIKLKQQEEDREDERRRNAEDLKAERIKESKIWDQKTARIQRDNSRATARFLKTKATPELYFLPWKLLPAQQQQIDAQIELADRQPGPDIAAHVTETESEGSPGAVRSLDRTAQIDGEEAPTITAGPDNNTEIDATTKLADSENNTDTRFEEAAALASPVATGGSRDVAEDNEELMVDAGEDPVIY